MTATASLAKAQVVLTRPARTSQRLARQLRTAGAQVLEFPAIIITPRELTTPEVHLLEQMAQFDWVVFISPSAIKQFFNQPNVHWPPALRAAVVGAGSARMLAQYGVTAALAPTQGAGARALLARPEWTHLAGQKVLIVAGAGGPPTLADTLRARGAAVSRIDLYTREPPRDAKPLAQWLAAHPHSVTLATSQRTLHHLDAALTGAQRQRLLHAPLVVPSVRVLKTAQALGFNTIIRADNADDAALIAALQAYFDGSHDG